MKKKKSSYGLDEPMTLEEYSEEIFNREFTTFHFFTFDRMAKRWRQLVKDRKEKQGTEGQ